MSDSEKEKAVEVMLQRTETVIKDRGQFHQAIQRFMDRPDEGTLQLIQNEFEKINSCVSELAPKVELFEQEAIFVDMPTYPILQPIRSDKLGILEHAVSEQIEKLDDELYDPLTYSKYHVILTKRMQHFNHVLNLCMHHLTEKL